MWRTLAGVSLLTALVFTAGPGHARQEGGDEHEIRRVVEDAYVSGIFIERDAARVRRGFHPDFVLSVRRDDSVLAITLDAWLDRLKLDGVRTRDSVTHRFDLVDVTGDTAIVKLRVTINGRHVYTDYLGLYRSGRGWQIVNKVFQGHD